MSCRRRWQRFVKLMSGTLRSEGCSNPMHKNDSRNVMSLESSWRRLRRDVRRRLNEGMSCRRRWQRFVKLWSGTALHSRQNEVCSSQLRNHGMVKSSPLRIGCHSSPDGSRLHKNSHSSSFVVADRPSPPEALPCRRCSWRSWGSVRRVAICLAARRPYLKLPNGNSRSFITQRAAHRDRMSQLALRIAKTNCRARHPHTHCRRRRATSRRSVTWNWGQAFLNASVTQRNAYMVS
mmetsp:Transcript_51101/g.119928  ORF Transcript_51101/g.119928 Transcript_51101/m.119928 type:complete len:235 (+) Transcript_51101:2-706(+)